MEKHNQYVPVPDTEAAFLFNKPKRSKRLLSLADHTLSLCIIGPCVVAFWRGAWQLMDIYSQYFPIDESLCIALILHLILMYTQTYFLNYFRQKDANLSECLIKHFLRRFYTYFYSLVCVMGWRGYWDLLDRCFNVQFSDSLSGPVLRTDATSVVLFIGAASLVLSLLVKCGCNCSAAPCWVSLDNVESTFTVPTRFKIKSNEKTSLYILDCLFSVLIVGTLVVFVWRGAWVLLDIFLFPENEYWSAWASLIVGYAAVAIAFLLQPFMRWLCDRLTGGFRLLAADLFLIFSLVGTVNVWRGIWNLLNLYFLTDNLELSCWVTHTVALIILILLGCSNSLLVRGVYIDAEEPAGKCVVFPCYYLRLMFQERKLKKIHRQSSVSKENELSNVKTIVENNHVEQQQNHFNRKEINNGMENI